MWLITFLFTNAAWSKVWETSYLFLNLEFPLTKKLQVKLSALHIKGIYEMWIWSVFSTHCYILQTLQSEIASAGSPLSNTFNTKNVFLVIYTKMRTVISNNYTIMLTVLLNKGISYLNSTHSNQFHNFWPKKLWKHYRIH